MLNRFNWLLPKFSLSLTGMEVAALGSAAANIYGAVSGGDSGSNTTKKINQMMPFKQIQWRVKDAKEAGIHPLYALGSPGMSPVPQTISGQSDRGGRIADAVAGGVQDFVRAKQTTTVQGAQIKQSDAQANYYNAMAKKVENDIQSGNDKTALDAFGGQTRVTPTEQKTTQSGDRSTQAGEHAFFKKYNVGGVTVYGPASEEPAEAFENVGGIIVSIPKNIFELGKWAVMPYARAIAKAVRASKAHKQTNKRGRNR